MRRLLGAEALKFRTTRAWIGFLTATVLLAGIASAGTVGDAEDARLGTPELTRDILSASLVASVIAFLVGVVSVTTEWRHGTVTRTFLATPRRGRVLVAKELFILLLALALAVLALVLVIGVAASWLAFEGSSLDVRGDDLGYVARLVASTMLWGSLGVGVGAVVHSQTPAIVGGILWVLLVEALVTALLGLVELDAVGDYLPGRALSAFDGSEDGLSMWAAGAVALGCVVALALAGSARIVREDVT